MFTWIYYLSQPDLFSVGYYGADGRIAFVNSDHVLREDAAARVNYLNGGHEPASRPVALTSGRQYDDLGDDD
jgi:hypothetical protein